jgi:hypothetical protein
VGDLVAELNGYRLAIREGRRMAPSPCPELVPLVGLRAERTPHANVSTTVRMTATSTAVAQSKPPAARLGARSRSLPEEI